MAAHNQLGKEGEQLAVAYLEQRKYVVLHRNWRFSHYEIDIIAQKEETIHIVEVKLRSSDRYGPPENAVSKKKWRDVMKAADAFLSLNPQFRYVQFDILSITNAGGRQAYFLIEDVFF